VVPDQDRAGLDLIDRAVELGWAVSIPAWEDCKDVNDAVMKYGRLGTLLTIMQARETSRIKIELRKKNLAKKYRNLWVFGDSYSTPGVCVTPTDSFWMKVAKQLQVQKVYNYSWPRNSFDSVIHTLISDSKQYNWQQDFFLIGVPVLPRLTVVGAHDKAYHRSVFDAESNLLDSELILCHHGLENKSFHDDLTSVRFENPTWTEVQACRSIFLLNQWLDNNNANYFIVNLSKDFMFDSPATGAFLQDYCFAHDRNILRGDTYYNLNLNKHPPPDFDRYGWAGHHGPDGNAYFFEQSLLPRLKKYNFI
jgi:hypothetical protein